MTKPRLDQGPDYERGFVDGVQHQMQSSVDKAVNRMAQPEPPPECQTETEKKAFAFGWWKAMEAQRLAQPEYQSTADKSKLEKVPAKGTLLAQPEQKHRRLPSWFYTPIGAYLFGLFMGWLIWGSK